MGFEFTSPVFEQAKSVHASDSAATVIGLDVGFMGHYSPCFTVHQSTRFFQPAVFSPADPW
jgi:hypothetical protein